MHALMLSATVFWAANIVAGKIVLRALDPLTLAQVRVVGGAVIFAALFLGWRKRPRLRLAPREWGRLALIALFGITLNQLFFISGISRTSAAHAGLIVALGPVMVLILSCALRLEALTVLKTIGAVVSFAGVALLTAGKAAGLNGAGWVGDVILIAGSGVFAYYTVLVKEVADRYDTVTLNTIIFALGAVFMLPFSARALTRAHWTGWPAEAWWGLAFMIFCGTGLAYFIYALALTELTATRVAAFNYLQPVIAAVLGVWLLAETIAAAVVAGGALILVGIYLTEHEGRQELGARS